MKAIVLVLLILLVFLGCAFIGFQAAGQISPARPNNIPTEPGGDFQGQQHNFLLVRVDQLDAPQPRLISIWFVSLFFLDDNPTILTLAQIYPSNSPSSGSLEKTFSLTDQGELSPAFWDVMDTYGFNWESYLVLDNAGANLLLQWLAGSGNFTDLLDAASANQASRASMVEQTCQLIAGAAGREVGQVDWSDLMPAHFRTNMRFESGLVYWDRMVDHGPVRCEILPAP